MPRPQPLYFLLLYCLLFAPVTQAKVFERWGKETAGPAGQYGWKLAYETEMNLNGVEGMVHVYGVDKSVVQVLEDLRKYYRQSSYHGEFFDGSPMAWGIGRDSKHAVRYFLQQGASPAQTLVYEIRQSIEAYKKSLAKGLQHHLKKVPVYPGSEPSFFMNDYGTETALEISTSDDSPESVTDHYHYALAQQGWKTRLGDAGSLRIFEKGKEIIIVSASEDEDGKTRISRTYKKLGVK